MKLDFYVVVYNKLNKKIIESNFNAEKHANLSRSYLLVHMIFIPDV